MLEEEKVPGKQTSSKRSKVNMIALWTVVLTALGSQGIPKVVELLNNKPSTEQVQQMIASQTEDLTKKFNELVDALKALTGKVADAQKQAGDLTAKVSRVEGETELIAKVLPGCCTKPQAVEQLKTVAVVPPPETAVELKTAVKETRDIKKKFQKVNDFKAQQVLGE